MNDSIFEFTEIDNITFAGKNFVLTGFGVADEKQMTQEIVSKGGRVRSSLVLATDYLIVNEYYDHQTVKYNRAVELNKAGKNIAIISGSRYMELCGKTVGAKSVETAIQDKAGVQKTESKPNVAEKKEIRRLTTIPTGSGNIEFDKVCFSLLGVTGEEKRKLITQIEKEGGIICNPGKKTQYLIYDTEKVESMSFWPKAKTAEEAGTMYLMPKEVFWTWVSKGYNIEKWNIDNNQLILIKHFLNHGTDWNTGRFGVKEKLEGLMLNSTDKIINELAKNESKRNDLKLYFSWAHDYNNGIWFSRIKKEKLTQKGFTEVVDDYFSESEAWRHAEQKVRDDMESYIISNTNIILQNLFDAGKTESMICCFDFLAEKEKNWVETGYSDGFFVYSLVNKYMEKSIDKKNLDMSAKLLDYKASHYDELFVEEADANELDIEFGLKTKPAVYFTKGASVFLGQYVQSKYNNAKPEPIEWIVLEQENGKALLISKYILEERKYHDEFIDITWENCALRKWLNNYFLNTAFTEDERAKIALTHLKNNRKYSLVSRNDTDDKIFLLSIDEAEAYFISDELRRAYLAADKSRSEWWWLRSPGSYSYIAAIVGSDGSVYEGGDCVDDDHGIRPALWINL